MAQQPNNQQQQPQNQNQGGLGGKFTNAMHAIFGAPQQQNTPPMPQQNQNNWVPPQNNQQQNNQSGIPDDNNNNNQNLQNQNQEPKSPLDDFADLWEPRKDKDGKPIVQNNEPIVAFDEQKFNDALSKLDLTKSIDPELRQKALGGDQQALSELLNGVGRSTLGLTAKMVTSLVKDSVTRSQDQIRREMGESQRSFATKQNLVTENPVLNHPAVSPLVSALEAQIRNKFPDASPQELTQHAKTALFSMAEAIIGKNKNSNEDNNSQNRNSRTQFGTDNIDWENFALGGDVNNISQM